MEWAGTMAGSIGIVIAMIEVLKRSSVGRFVPERDWGLIALGLGIVAVAMLAQIPDNDVGEANPVAWVVCGIIVGLAASGAYDTSRAQAKRRTARERDPSAQTD